MRAFLAWLASGAAALEALGGEECVEAMRLASYLEVPRLLRAVERRLVEGVDEENALPLLALADEAGARALFATATVAALDALDRRCVEATARRRVEEGGGGDSEGK